MASSTPDNRYAVREIDYREIECLETVGEGTFGVVYKGLWCGKYVAVKTINTQTEMNKTFMVEVRQLSRVDHENIVKLYGACTRGLTCLVMEYAEGGSLFNVLHCAPPRIHYTLAHALSWLHQCAKGVAYLHAMKPKPLIHRDLKPPNLLLINGGTLLKICDFGTAADKSTYMTNNKGSAAWMAPEVFTSSNYTEKCDVFSWGIILWEVLSRRKPFFNLGGTAYTIMWAVYKGTRPPLMQNCPRPLETLIAMCWDQEAGRRPPMHDICHRMDVFCQLIPGGQVPLEYDEQFDGGGDVLAEDEEEPPATAQWGGVQPSPPQTKIPSSSKGAMKPLHLDIEPNSWEQSTASSFYGEHFRNMRLKTMPGFDKMVPKKATATEKPKEEAKINIIRTNNRGGGGGGSSPKANSEEEPPRKRAENDHRTKNEDPNPEDLDQMYLLLDPHLRPSTPDPNDAHSMDLYEEHKQLAKEYLKVQTEVALMSQRKQQLLAEQTDEERKRIDLIQKLQQEKQSLLMVRDLLKRQKDLSSSTNNTATLGIGQRGDHT